MYQNNKTLICTGGTGGHVIPAINFANFLIEQGYECSIILDRRGNKYAKKQIQVGKTMLQLSFNHKW